MQDLYFTAQKWLSQDPDEETRAELQQLIEQAQTGNAAAHKALTERFSGRLQFGTAGLRGQLRAGSMGMNRVLVAQTAKGLADYLQQFDTEPSIVIGYDGRKNSQRFAQDTAEIMAGAGIRTFLLPRCLPTPVLAFALRYFDTSAGVMVTASHNPAHDNGYKVYLGKGEGGGQITAPADKHIAEFIEHAAQQNIRQYSRSTDYITLSETVIEQYVKRTARLASAPSCALNYVYTALHGVGTEVLLKTLSAADLPLPHVVQEQSQPNAAFPTVAFPNPEEKGALDLAIALAKEKQAQFIIANDPDADRFAVALPDHQGQWRMIHGNMIGCYLAWHIAQKAAAQHRKGALVCSLVSSPALEHIAQRYGLTSTQTLTGFKYIAKVPHIIYGFEESLGYLVDPNKVHDKDGISAAVAFLDLVCSLKAQGQTLQDYMQAFTQEFGAYASEQVSIRVRHLTDISALMTALRLHAPAKLGDSRVVRCQDYLHNDEPNDILVYFLDNDGRLIVRPSGTEPKVKFYLDVKGDTAETAAHTLAQLSHAVREMLRSNAYGNYDC